jgi:hypothetical protein
MYNRYLLKLVYPNPDPYRLKVKLAADLRDHQNSVQTCDCASLSQELTMQSVPGTCTNTLPFNCISKRAIWSFEKSTHGGEAPAPRSCCYALRPSFRSALQPLTVSCDPVSFSIGLPSFPLPDKDSLARRRRGEADLYRRRPGNRQVLYALYEALECCVVKEMYGVRS